MPARFDSEVRRRILRLAAQGMSRREIAEQVLCSTKTVWRVVRPFGGVYRAEWWVPSPSRLSLEERIEIKLGLERRESCAAIGRRLGRACSTITREIDQNGGRRRYRPMAAHERACRQARRPKATKLVSSPALCARVISDLEAWWSPEQIARQLRADFRAIQRCACRTKRSTGRCMCRAAVSYAANSLVACEPAVQPANRRAVRNDAVRSRAWS